MKNKSGGHNLLIQLFSSGIRKISTEKLKVKKLQWQNVIFIDVPLPAVSSFEIYQVSDQMTLPKDCLSKLNSIYLSGIA